MENKLIIKVILVAVLFSFTACDVADIKGMFISPDELINQRFEQSMEWNSQHALREVITLTDDYTILSMSDNHVGGTINLDIFINEAKNKNANAVVMVGDLTSGHGEDFEIFKQHLINLDSLPAFLMIGNHDLYYNGWNEYFSRFGSSTYTFTVKTPVASDLYICLDSGGGTIGNQQLDWLKDILQNERPDYRRCIIFTHNNLFRFRRTSSTNPLVEELHVLLDLFTKHNVDMVVTGHDHEKDDEVFGNTTHIVMDALKDGLSNSGYFQFNVADGNITYEFINL